MHGMARGDELIGDRLWRFIAIANPMPCACTPGSLAGGHLWLFFLIILLFAACPAAFAALSVAFLRACHLVLAGIALRGAAFVFRTYRTHIGGAPRIWGRVFAIASTLPPALLGTTPRATATGDCVWWTG